jgi:hypothetical protein
MTPDDRPIRLSKAAELAFPDGSMTASGLRREAAKGRLVIERIAGKDYTTLANVQRMRELCRVEPRGRTSGCSQQGAMSTDGSPSGPSGSSETAAASEALAAARATLKGLKERSETTSPENIGRRGLATVTPLPSRSQT